MGVSCLDAEQALSYLAGESVLSTTAVLSHLDECGRCRLLLVDAAGAGPPATGVSSAMTFAPGDRVAGRYQVLRLLGRGGMGEVYEVADDLLEDTVALKTLTCAALDDPAAIARLKAEVKRARQVTHVNVSRILDFGIHDVPTYRARLAERTPFFTMELLRGETLAARLRRVGRLVQPTAGLVIADMLSGLAEIHRAGIVHCDFKPENVMLVSGAGGAERAVVTDFGLAHRTTGPSSFTGATFLPDRVAGTIDYMPPEQLLGGPPTQQFDVYAAGMVIFELLTGRKAFPGDTPAERAAARLRGVAPCTSAPGLDETWRGVVESCLEVRSPRRSVDEVRRLLDPVRAKAHPRGWWAMGLALVAATAIGGWLVERDAGGQVAPRFSPPAPAGRIVDAPSAPRALAAPGPLAAAAARAPAPARPRRSAAHGTGARAQDVAPAPIRQRSEAALAPGPVAPSPSPLLDPDDLLEPFAPPR